MHVKTPTFRVKLTWPRWKVGPTLFVWSLSEPAGSTSVEVGGSNQLLPHLNSN